ncbi:MAG: nuclease-related domain-containing protein [Sporomusaceae bacterium]|nr:nuclease-related domain-containing protein [Sporomusaceae bacterium]
MAYLLKADSLLEKEAMKGKRLMNGGIALSLVFVICHFITLMHGDLPAILKYGSLVGIGIGILLNRLALQHYGACMSGAEGERRVSAFLVKELSNDWVILNDLEVQSNQKTAQIDHLLVGPYGIVLIETKNVKGRISLTDNKQYWAQEKRYDTKQFYSPTLQARGHEAAIKSVISLFHLDKYIPIRSVVLFSDEGIELKLPLFVDGVPVKKLETLAALDFTGGKEPVFSKQEVDYISRILLGIHGEPIEEGQENVCTFHHTGRFGI